MDLCSAAYVELIILNYAGTSVECLETLGGNHRILLSLEKSECLCEK